MTGRNTCTSQKAGISEALLSFSQKPRAKSPTPPERPSASHHSHIPTLQPDFLFPAPDNSEEPCTPEEDELQDPFLQQEDDPKPGERDLAQALEFLANKIAGMPSAASKLKNQVKPRIPDTFDSSDPGKLETFIFQCSMYLAIHASDFSDDEARVTFALSYLKDSPQDWFQSEISHMASKGGR